MNENDLQDLLNDVRKWITSGETEEEMRDRYYRIRVAMLSLWNSTE